MRAWEATRKAREEEKLRVALMKPGGGRSGDFGGAAKGRKGKDGKGHGKAGSEKGGKGKGKGKKDSKTEREVSTGPLESDPVVVQKKKDNRGDSVGREVGQASLEGSGHEERTREERILSTEGISFTTAEN